LDFKFFSRKGWASANFLRLTYEHFKSSEVCELTGEC
jgi:hypothetical protein